MNLYRYYPLKNSWKLWKFKSQFISYSYWILQLYSSSMISRYLKTWWHLDIEKDEFMIWQTDNSNDYWLMGLYCVEVANIQIKWFSIKLLLHPANSAELVRSLKRQQIFISVNSIGLVSKFVTCLRRKQTINLNSSVKNFLIISW